MAAVAGPSSQPYGDPAPSSSAPRELVVDSGPSTNELRQRRKRQKQFVKLREQRNAQLDQRNEGRPLHAVRLPRLQPEQSADHESKHLLEEQELAASRDVGRKALVRELATYGPIPLDDAFIPLDPFREARQAFRELVAAEGATTEPRPPRPAVPPRQSPAPASNHAPATAVEAAASKTAGPIKIPLVPRSPHGTLLMPFSIGGFVVHQLGRPLISATALHPAYLVPVGYIVTRPFFSGLRSDAQSTLTCYIIDKGGVTIFRIVSSETPDIVAESANIAQAVAALYAPFGLGAPKLQSALDFFGLGVPSIQYLLQSFLGPDPAATLPWYKPQAFEESAEARDDRNQAMAQMQNLLRRVKRTTEASPPVVPPPPQELPGRSRSASNASAHSAYDGFYGPPTQTPYGHYPYGTSPSMMSASPSLPSSLSHLSPNPGQMHRSASASSSAHARGSPPQPYERELYGPPPQSIFAGGAYKALTGSTLGNDAAPSY